MKNNFDTVIVLNKTIQLCNVFHTEFTSLAKHFVIIWRYFRILLSFNNCIDCKLILMGKMLFDKKRICTTVN